MQLCGTVIRGEGRGKDLGFPTANIETSDSIPDSGVYAGIATIGTEQYLAAIHIGPRPTFDDLRPTLEAHLLDFSKDLYGKEVCIDIRQKLRGVKKFDTIEALRQAIENDCAAVRKLLRT
ncbi:MAG: riboflavin kinase [Candidatus Andersenbacteria bacterium]|nr:riboflavin kinase [Candidatus Andersenbacteria bacterium]MBI3250454.1 riboflavin kinase [Candidatus Andersenbacteria bacterium]